MSDNYYYTIKKSQFKSLFGKDWDENISDFLKYVNIEITKDLLGNMDDLKDSIKELAESNLTK